MASHGIRDRVAIVGMGCTNFGEHWDRSADDLLVLDGRTTFVGPRSIDLREDAAAQLGAGEAIGVTGARGDDQLAISASRPVQYAEREHSFGA